ncbi:hypothetical protein [uncultured Thiodictyon sp.]|jgi:hypothetical protein|uniref:hypothetical protein n=1 Tax=uncultured Thiodictyon sp. TaxID=1846217 RepID=UPI0025FCE1AA|nr:hypothetical protein [uncultured Thiodictyon sp.]
MNYTNFSHRDPRTAMIEEALTLMHIIDAEHSQEDINEGAQARTTRLLLRDAARQLVPEMVAELRKRAGAQTQVPFFANAA